MGLASRWAAYVLLGLLFPLTAPADQPAHDKAATLSPGDTIPATKLVSVEGMAVTLRPPSGRVLLILAVDPAQSSDDESVRAFIPLYRRLHAKGLDVVGVCPTFAESRFFRLAERWQVPWPHVIDEKDAKVTEITGLHTAPGNVLVDSSGKVLAVNLKSDKAHEVVAQALHASLDAVPMPEPAKPREEPREVQMPAEVSVAWQIMSRLGDADERQDAEACKKNLRRLRIALTRYQQDHDGKMPEWLSDLRPKYISDDSVFICPKDSSPPSQYKYAVDTKIKSNYVYDFVPVERGGKPLRDWRTQQLSEWGDKVPVVRCLHHARPLTLSYGGEVYFGELNWKRQFPTGHTLDDKDAKVRERLRLLAEALDRYRKDKGDVPPDELDALVPAYIKDKELLKCPVTGKPFSYQFSASDKGRRESKLTQLKQFGDYVPLLRARDVLDGGNVINLSVGGEIYDSPDRWESLFE